MPRKIFFISLIFILILCQSILAKTPPAIPAQDYTIWGRVYLKDPQQANSVALTHNDSVYIISLKIDSEILASYSMGSDPNYADYYVLKVPMNSRISGQNIANIYINEILASEVYLEPTHTAVKLPIKIGESGQTVAMDLILYVDKTPPYVTNQNPLPDSSANRDTTIYVEVKDDRKGVDVNSLQMSVEGNVVNPSIESILKGYALTYIPSEKFQPDQVVDVIISATDLSNPPNKLSPSFSYHFITKNRVPIVKELTISPSSPKGKEELKCSYVYSDADGDIETGSEIRWYKDEVYQSSYKNKLVVSTTKRGQLWYVTVKPRDGTDFGNVYKSATVTIGNTPPIASDLKLAPSEPKTTDELVCSYDYTDVDGDVESGSEIRWHKSGVVQDTYNDLDTLPSSALRKGDKWSFSIRPNDGLDFGDQQTSLEVTIGNSPPLANNVKITPSSPKESEKLICSYDYVDTDGDTESGTTLRWYRNGSLQDKYNDQREIPIGIIKSGEGWRVVVRPSDGITQGKYQTSETVTVGNTPPEVSELIVEIAVSGNLTGKYTYYDAGGDKEDGTEIWWYKNGVLQSKYDDQKTVSSAEVKKGENWYFSVKPKDGTDYGEQKVSPSVTIGNTAPLATNLAMMPSTPFTVDSLVCSYEYSDGNGDIENGTEIRWYKDTIEQLSYKDIKIIPPDATTKGEKWHFTVRPKDGIDYGSLKQSAIVTIANTPPSVKDLVIIPSSPKGKDELKCSYVYSDADGDIETGSEIRWYKDEVYQSGYKNKLVVSTTKRGQLWYVTVKPRDGTDFGDVYKSAIVTIVNTAPTTSDLKITLLNPTDKNELNCDYTYSDFDDDPESGTEIRWYKDKILQEKYNDQLIIQSVDTNKGEHWYFTIKPKDGTDYGEVNTSPEAIIEDSLPTVSNLIMTPLSPLIGDNLVCSYEFSDVNGDTENGTEIRWYMDNVLQETYNDQKMIPSNAIAKGQKWQFTVKPKDGMDYGELKSSPIVKIGNILPQIKELNIIPEKPLTDDILKCNYIYYDSDGDPENGTEIKWYKDGVYQSTYKNKTSISANSIGKGQIWYVTVKPNDGSDFGELKQSVSVQIGNTPPTADELKIKPLNPLTDDDLACNYSYNDLDSDPENGTEIRWYKDNVLQEKYNDQKAIPSSMTLRDEKWQFTVKPKDGTDYGDLKTSSDVTIGNTPPTADNLVITPLKPTLEDNLSFSYQYSDTDKDTENGTKIIWYKNGEQQVTYDNIVSIPSIELIAGQKWYVIIQPCDGTQFGETKQSKVVTIAEKTEVNPPEATDLRISPEKPLTTDNLQCEYKYVDLDNDPENGTEIRWYKDKILQEKYNDQLIIQSVDTNKGEHWYFTIKPKDGTDYGEVNTSPEAIIEDSLPTVSNLIMTPLSPLIGDNLVCSYEFSDVNGDTENGTEIRWYMDNVLQETYNDQKMIPSNAIAKGQKWQFTVKPKDGMDYGELKSSPIVKIGNILPQIKELNIIPEKPLTDDILKCNYIYYDSDGDPENGTEIKWYKDGVYQSTYKNKTSISANSIGKGQIWYVTVKPNDGSDFGELKQSVSVQIGNTPPTADELKIKPLNPLTDDDLACNYSYNDLDSDPENGTEIRWYKDNVLQEKYNDQKAIPSSMTLRDEKWQFTVKPKDGTDYGDLKTSSDVTIGNTPPTADNLVITPLKPTLEDNLSFSYQYSDTDKDTENGTKIIWYKNGEQQVTYDNIVSIPSIELIAGQKWYVIIQPCDGTQFGETKQSKVVTIAEKTEVNPPEATDLRISPEKPLTTDNLQCEYKYVDLDNDPENGTEIRWYKNNILQKTYNDKKVASASDTVKGESWYFTVKPKNGKNFGDLKTSPTVTIINTPPTLTSINVKPAYPKKTDNLLCDYVYSDLDRDTENGTEIKWYKDEVLQLSYNDLRIIPPVELVKGQKWYCTIRLKDGTDFSELKTSAIVTIGNTEPVATNLIISPIQPLTTDSLTCSYEYTDADNDIETGTDIRWYKNEELQTLYNDQKRIPQEETAKGQKWYFAIKPRDGISYGEVQNSSVITIGDTPPTISDIGIIPVLAMKKDNLICHYTYKDADSDAEIGTEIKWFKNNKQQTEFNNQTQISSSAFSKGEKWYFRVRTSYDKKFTDWQESPTITIRNSQPNAFVEADNYVVAVGSQIKFYGSKSSDADNDKLSYQWNFDANNNTSVDATNQDPIYVYENEGEYTVTLMVNDGEIDSAIASVKVKVEAKLTLISASYDIPDTKLTLKFNKPIQPKAFDGEMIRMETVDNVDLQLHGKYQPIINWTDPSEVLIDLSDSFSTAFGLVLAGVVNHRKVDLSLQEGIFMDTSGISNQPVSLVVDMISDRFKIGLIGDVNGSGTLTMYDAEVTLQSSVSGTQTLPIYDSAMDVSRWLAIHEYTYDAVMDIADMDKDGQISSYDTSLIMRMTAKRDPDSSDSVINPTFRKAVLKINHNDSAGLDMSVVLDDSSGIYSVDLIITYDPQVLAINQASKSSTFSDWLFAQATPESGKLKIAMAGFSAISGNGSIADLSFSSLMEGRQLPIITGIQLNGRRISVSIENVPDHSALLQNYPNPCNNETWIPYLLSFQSKVYVCIYNSKGNIIRSFNLGTKEPGDYTNKSKAVFWDCRNESGEKVSSGIYFYEIRTDKYSSIKKMIVIG